MKLDELIGLYAGAKVKIPGSVVGEVKELLSWSIEDLVMPEILKQMKARIEDFESQYRDLRSAISEFAGKIDEQTAGKKAECVELREDKTRIVSSIAETYAAGGDGSKLYAKLAKVDSELNLLESFLEEMDRLKRYPDAQIIIQQAEKLLEVGKELIRFWVREFKPQKDRLTQLYRNLALLCKAAESQLNQCDCRMQSVEQFQIVPTLAQTIPAEAAEMSPDELRHKFSIEIDKILN